MIQAGISVKDAKVAILGLTFKENCPDIRNTKVMDIVEELRQYGVCPVIADPVADCKEAKSAYGISLCALSEIKDCNAVVLAVAHQEFAELSIAEIDAMFQKIPAKQKVLVDVKGLFCPKDYEAAGYRYWRL